MLSSSRNADRVLRLLRFCECEDEARFPATDLFNEGWMLRLILDAFERLNIRQHPLSFEANARWYSEARLGSRFRAQQRGDKLAEGVTHADGVVGHFDFRATTTAGLTLRPDGTQFVVLEAKMFSPLTPGTTNAPSYNQAARNVACMAEAIAQGGTPVAAFASLGFFVLAPRPELRGADRSKLEAFLDPNSIKLAVHQRISAYEEAGRAEAPALRAWENDYVLPLVSHLAETRRLAVLSWDECIDAVANVDAMTGDDLRDFYRRCLSFAPPSGTRSR